MHSGLVIFVAIHIKELLKCLYIQLLKDMSNLEEAADFISKYLVKSLTERDIIFESIINYSLGYKVGKKNRANYVFSLNLSSQNKNILFCKNTMCILLNMY